MIWEKLQGVDAIQQMMDQVSSAARDELAVELGIISRDLLAWQRSAAPKDTGELAGFLSIWVMVDELRARVGFISAKGARGQGNKTKVFYGRFVQYGRKAQTVLVTRHLKRKVRGNGRYGTTKRVIYDGKPYPLRVKAMAPRNFIFAPNADAIVAQRVADFWSNTFQRAGV
ncbi:hypothetical protein S2M10_31690 [Sphingomonas sp. S2M10]|uniref:hypothetical protein n=1 Tax=Sphingomonas sp. S2M10 TaxID=2705010 RepID=UPI0014573053|nr:hypothetical protein [Sphingomonas sp. S2M10]NLS28160.1 hypothetical protein [Sphingomonas sp. S2M10]